MAIKCRRSYVITACVMLVFLHHMFLFHKEGAIKGYLYPRKKTRPMKQHTHILDSYVASLQVKDNLNPPPWWDGGDDCGCEGGPNVEIPKMEDVVGGTCGARAWASGEGQKVIAYSLYGNETVFYEGLNFVLTLAVQFYPGYYVRLYTEPTDQIKPIICPLICQFPNLHVCDVRNLPAPLGDVTKNANDDPRIWRFLPMGDPQVDVSLSRDTDSKFTQREVSAVNEWLGSGVALHVMRDHQMHRACILGGTWGVRTDHSSPHSVNSHENLVKLMNQLLKVSVNGDWGNDQVALQKVVWPALRASSMRHESYHCKEYQNSRPFPTRRENQDYIGAKWYRTDGKRGRTNKPCTYQCRPVDHKDWRFC